MEKISAHESAKALVRRNSGGIVYYTIPAFDKTNLVVNAFSTRLGGISSGSYDSLNLSILTNDDLAKVLENRRRFLTAIGIGPDRLVGARQVHEDRIGRVTKEDRGRGAFDPGTVIPATDALMTGEPGVALTAFFADCVPVFFLDPVKRVIALAHAGWRGTVAKIAAKTVLAMQEAYGCAAKDILAAVGPSIGPCHYEVDKPVLDKVNEAFPEYWKELFKDRIDMDRTETDKTDQSDFKGQLDLWAANFRQLADIGIPIENITVAGLCTYCRHDEFFSHRAGMAGRQAAVLMLKDDFREQSETV